MTCATPFVPTCSAAFSPSWAPFAACTMLLADYLQTVTQYQDGTTTQMHTLLSLPAPCRLLTTSTQTTKYLKQQCWFSDNSNCLTCSAAFSPSCAPFAACTMLLANPLQTSTQHLQKQCCPATTNTVSPAALLSAPPAPPLPPAPCRLHATYKPSHSTKNQN
jgi:hypothetical protein